MSIFDIVATLVLAVVLVAFAVQGTGELAQMQTATDDYIQCETLARQLQRRVGLPDRAGADVHRHRSAGVHGQLL